MKNKCKICSGKLDIHYGSWCPKCDKPEPEERLIYEYYKVARYIAANEGYNKKWVNDVLVLMDVSGNDSYIDWYIGDQDEYDYGQNTECMVQFDRGLMKYFGLQQGDSLILSFSW